MNFSGANVEISVESRQPPQVPESAQDMRLYFWVPSHAVGFLQAVIDAEDNLGRIRTERQKDGKALILFMGDWSRASEVSLLLTQLQQDADISIEFVDSSKQLPV